jgi:hypothetical protein
LQLRERSLAWSRSHKHPEFRDRTIFEVYEEEREHLIKYRGEFEGYKLYPTVVSPLSLVQYDTNMYSVPCEYVGVAVNIKSYAWKVVTFHEGKVISRHNRCFLRHQKIYNPLHYLPVLERKPGALRNGLPFKELMSSLPEIFTKIRNKLESYEDGGKQFIIILSFINKLGLEKVTHACCRAINAGGCSAKLVEQYLYPSIPIEEEEYKFIELKTQPDDDCSIYSKLYLKS